LHVVAVALDVTNGMPENGKIDDQQAETNFTAGHAASAMIDRQRGWGPGAAPDPRCL